MRIDEAAARERECPTCGAVEGQPCWTLSTPLRIKPQAHAERYRAAGITGPTLRQWQAKHWGRVVDLREWVEKGRGA